MKPHQNFFMKPKSFGLVLSLLSNYIQGNTVEKDFQILIKLNLSTFIPLEEEKNRTKMIKTFN